MKCMKSSFKRLLAGTLGLVLFISSNMITEAATSDQVVLSISRPGAGYVNTVSDPLRVRELPSTSSTVVATLPRESMIMIVERCNNGFYKVQYDANGHYGYVASQYICEYDLEYYCAADTSTNLNMRSGMGTSYGVVARIPSQQRFPILLEISSWDYALYGNIDGYVSTNYITKYHY